METLRECWSAGRPTMGAWLTLPTTVSAEAAGRTGFDYVCVDTQHGANDYQGAVAMIQAVLFGGSRAVVRVPWNEPGIIGKMLDAGAEGVIVPMVNTVSEAEAVVHACRYPPLGSRSHGPVMAGMRRGDYAATANARVAVIPMIETREALDNIDDVLAVEGIDAIYVGPADLSLSLGLPPGNNDDRAEFTEALEVIAGACKRAGVTAGIHSTGALAARRLELGFRMITVAGDLLAMRTQLGSELAAARGAAQDAGPASMY
jgi:4-hydroxy-2-oxoheptanedioate aldolase